MNTTEPTYKVVFSGSTLSGNNVDDVAMRFADAFKLKDKRSLEKLFSGKIITLKSGLSHEQAQRYGRILNKLGAECCIERENTALFYGFDPEPDHDYERKKRQRVAQFSAMSLADVGLAPK